MMVLNLTAEWGWNDYGDDDAYDDGGYDAYGVVTVKLNNVKICKLGMLYWDRDASEPSDNEIAECVADWLSRKLG